MFHHSIVGHLRADADEPVLSRTYAGSAPPDKSQEVYVIVEPVTMTDNGEIQSGQVSPKKGFLMVSIYGTAKQTLADLEPYAVKVKSLLSNRNYAITGYHVYGTLLKNEMPLDFVTDPHGSETGVCCVKLMYSCNYGSRS